MTSGGAEALVDQPAERALVEGDAGPAGRLGLRLEPRLGDDDADGLRGIELPRGSSFPQVWSHFLMHLDAINPFVTAVGDVWRRLRWPLPRPSFGAAIPSSCAQASIATAKTRASGP